VGPFFGSGRDMTGADLQMPVKVTLRREDASPESRASRMLRHPVFAWLGTRPILADHTRKEHGALTRWSAGRRRLVEIGVAEGASALALREAMSPEGTLWLVDPFHLSRISWLNATRRAAHRAIAACKNGEIVWVEKFSAAAARDWNGPIDFLFIDGDHSEAGVQQDWDEWHRFVAPDGIVCFHDAALFPGGWTAPDWGPVKLVDRLFRDGNVPGWKLEEQVDSLVVVKRVPGESGS